MTEFERKLAELIWEHEPIGSGELVKLCETRLQWKKSTTYTMLKRICSQGICKNENACVTSVLSREEYCRQQGEAFLMENYNGSLPSFVAAFMERRRLSRRQVEQIKEMIADYEEEDQ